MKERMLKTKIWDDSYFNSLNLEEKMLFIYLLTNSLVNLCGLYECPLRKIEFDTGVNRKKIELIMVKFQEDHKFIYYHEWVKIVNYEKYNKYTSPTVTSAKQKELEEIPKEIIEGVDTVCIGYTYPSDTSNINNSINNSKKGGVGENKPAAPKNPYPSLESIMTEEVVTDLATELTIRPEDVIAMRTKLIDWVESKGKSYKNYKAALRTWLRADIDKGEIKLLQPSQVKKPIAYTADGKPVWSFEKMIELQQNGIAVERVKNGT